MATSSTLSADAPDVDPRRWSPSPTVVAVGGFILVSVLLLVLGRFAVDHQAVGLARQEFEPGVGWWGQWVRWDGNWYFHIARDGYAFHVGPQQSVAFWPVYPLVMRFLSVLTNDQYDSGLIITWLSGFGTIVLLSIWCRDRIEPRRHDCNRDLPARLSLRLVPPLVRLCRRALRCLPRSVRSYSSSRTDLHSPDWSVLWPRQAGRWAAPS